jgi:general secretion pathway protein L
VIVDDAGAVLTAVGGGDLADAKALAANRQLIVLVPGEQVTLAEAMLPVKGAGKALAVVPFAMEEQLAQDVELLHFAVGRTGEDGRTPVAAVHRSLMDGWLQSLRDAGLEPAAMYPETLCLPDNPGKAVVLLDERRLFVRPAGYQPFVLDVEPLAEAFAVAGLEGEDRHLHCHIAERDWRESQVAIEALRELCGSLDVQLMPEGSLRLLAAQAVRSPPWSLLVGAYATRSGLQGDWRRWGVAASLAAALALAHVGFQTFRLVTLGRAEVRLDAAIEQTFRTAMPDVQRIVDAKAQMRSRLSAGGSSAGMLGPLATVGGVLGGVPSASVQSLAWQDGALDLRVRFDRGEDLAALSRSLGQRGVAVDVQSTAVAESGFEGRLRIKVPNG